MAAKAKKKNFIQLYFSNFGIRQICDFLMVGAAIVMFVGFFLDDLIITIGLGIYVVASLIAIIRSVRVLVSDINHKAPVYKNAVANVVIMGLIFALATVGFILGFII